MSSILFSPFNILFFAIVTGLAIGKIRICRISLGIAGVLFISILIGYLINISTPETYMGIISNTRDTMKTFSKLGSSLFVSVIGLQTGFSIKNKSKDSLLAFVIGIFMSIGAVLTMLLIFELDQTVSYASLLGVLCGALTSTPGLSGVCDILGNGSEEAVWGYGCSYLFGVIIAVLFAQLSSRKTMESKGETSPHISNVANKFYPEIILICITALLGSIVGEIYIPFLNISIGNTAGVLLIGLCFGALIRRKIQVSLQVLQTFKNLGLVLFFAGTGFNTGVQIVSFDIKTVIYGVLITLSAVFSGILLCWATSRPHSLHNGFIIAGGMTSSPAYGAISSKTEESAINQFSFAYFGALMSLVVAIQIFGR